MPSERIAKYSIRIMAPAWSTYLETFKSNADANNAFDTANQAALDELVEKSALSHAEDIINDSLPEGFYCKIEDN